MRKIIIFTLFFTGLWHVSASGYMLAKAYLSQYLIADAWQKTQVDKQSHKPWSWADTYPVFEMSIPRLNQKTIVLEGDTGRNMAFSAAHNPSSGLPGENKTIIVSGHRDSHFEYLQDLKLGDELITTNKKNETIYYKVNRFEVVDSRIQHLIIKNSDELILTTCYPFNALQTGGKYRFAVYAVRI